MNFKLAAFADEASGKLDGQILAMKRNGVDFLEIRGVDGENIADISVEKAKEIEKKLSDNGLAVWSLGSPYGKLGITDDFDAHLDKFKRSIEVAHVLKAEHMRIFSFYVRPEDSEKYRDKVFRQLERFCEAASGSGVILCHENEKGIYGDIADRCLDIHKNIPQLRAVFDPANFIQCGVDILKAYDKLAPYTEYMHIKDALRECGRVVPAGYGDGDVKYILNDLLSGFKLPRTFSISLTELRNTSNRIGTLTAVPLPIGIKFSHSFYTNKKRATFLLREKWLINLRLYPCQDELSPKSYSFYCPQHFLAIQ